MPKTYEYRFTTAPAAYDGFGTLEVAVVGIDRDLPVRLVAINLKHRDRQEGRYASGHHGALTLSKWIDLVKKGICKWSDDKAPAYAQLVQAAESQKNIDPEG